MKNLYNHNIGNSNIVKEIIVIIKLSMSYKKSTMKRKNKEVDKCLLCGKKTTRKINFHRNQKRQYDCFACKKCRPSVCG